MKQFLGQYKKEFHAHFGNCNAFIILAAYSVLSFFAALYLGNYFRRESDIFNAYFATQPFILMLIIPAVTMRSWADEIKSGTLELLLTQPVCYGRLVLAKFLAAYSFFLVMVAFSLPFLFVTDALVILDYGVIQLGYGGLLLCGAMFTALGCLVSTLNRSMIVCYLATIVLLFSVLQFNIGSVTLGKYVINLQALNFDYNYCAFFNGILFYGNVFYFVIGTILVLWLNTVRVGLYKYFSMPYKKQLVFFSFLLWLIFASFVLGGSFLFTSYFDMTHNKQYTLSEASHNFLINTTKRIDITLYEARNVRDDTYSNYAVYAEYVERLLQLLERESNGAVRHEIIRVEPFSSLERRIIDRGIPFSEDVYGNKIFMFADFSDNDGNQATIAAFSNLRQDLLETDIMRVIRRFGKPLKNIAVIASQNDLNEMEGFNAILKEFYNVSYLNFYTPYIAPLYHSVVVVNPKELSSEFLLALDQYILHGGHLIVFQDAEKIQSSNRKILFDFLDNYGIKPAFEDNIDATQTMLTTSKPIADEGWKNARFVVTHLPGKIDFNERKSYSVSPILKIHDKIIGVEASGRFVSAFQELASKTSPIIDYSTEEGTVYFFYDSDILKDYLYISEETKGTNFYQLIPFADNMLFLLQLFNNATGEDIETSLTYRRYELNASCIGNALFNSIRRDYTKKEDALKKQIEEYEIKQSGIANIMTANGYASIKNVGDINSVAQNLNEAKDALNRLKMLIYDDYQLAVLMLTAVIILLIPTVLLLILMIVLYLFNKRQTKKIRRIIDDAQTD